VEVVAERVDVELSGKEFGEFVEKGARGLSVASAVAELDVHEDLLDSDGDEKEAVLLDPFDEVVHVVAPLLLLLLLLLNQLAALEL